MSMDPKAISAESELNFNAPRPVNSIMKIE